jgi:hypothetical protein
LFAINHGLPFFGASGVILIGVALLWPLWRGVPGRTVRRLPVEVAAEARQSA